MKINNYYVTNILRMNNEGEGVCIIDNITTFVKYALPLELVRVRIDKIYDNYARATLIEIVEKSKNRTDPICPNFYTCGGCNLMHLYYKKQLEFKKEKVQSIFKKISKEDIYIKNIYSYNDLFYRNKVVFKVKDNRIGFYKEKTNELIDIEKCFIIDNRINDVLLVIRNFINKYSDNDISEVMIRIINNEVMLSINNINNKIKQFFLDYFKDLDSIYINNALVYGKKLLNEKINNLNFSISPKSFFQVNKNVSEMVYEKAISYINKSDLTLDLYSGTGTISMLLSKKSNQVIGVEVVKDAVNDAILGIEKNKIDNVKFICEKVENVIDKLKKLNIDNVILDPPRSGSDRKSLNSILEISPNQIIYISCNPVTLARDYNILKEKYLIKDINLYDMFPNTYHVETVMVLEKKDV